MSTRTKDYILTESGNRISREGLNLVNTQAIVLGGKTILEPHVTMRGDLHRKRKTEGIDAALSIGRYCLLSRHTYLSPPYKLRPSPTATTMPRPQDVEEKGEDEGMEKVYYPLKMGDYVHIGAHSRVEAASIASFVHIGSHCTIGNMSIIKEGSIIEDDTVIPPYSVIAPLSRVRGRPGLVVAECPEVTIDVIRERLRDHYAAVLGAK